jgi:hypothetical protein
MWTHIRLDPILPREKVDQNPARVVFICHTQVCVKRSYHDDRQIFENVDEMG